MAELSEAINLDEIAVGLPRRIHEVTARQVAEAPDRIALIEDGAPGATAIWISASPRSPPSSRSLGDQGRATG